MMAYQELEIGFTKKLVDNAKRNISAQLIINGCLLVCIVLLSIGSVYNVYQIQVLHRHLNETHHRMRELEAWQQQMCKIRHYNCLQNMEIPEYPDEWDWYNSPSMDDYVLENSYPDHYERNKREVVAETTDGVPINTQPYADAKLRKPGRRTHSSVPVTQGGFHSPAWSQTPQDAELKLYEDLANTQMAQEEEDEYQANRQKVPTVKSLNANADNAEMNYPITSRDRRQRTEKYHQSRMTETFDEPLVATVLKPTLRTYPAAHFHGDTSKYVFGVHTNYNGNGRMKHKDKTYVDWVSSDWMKHEDAFTFHNGYLTIHEPGLYFIYAQIYYLDDHDLNGYRVYRNEETILQCTTMTHSTSSVRKSNTCYTAGAEYLSVGDRISVRDLSVERYSLFEKGKSFFGALKMSDMRVK